MPTNKQKALAKKIIENQGISMGRAMKEVGYTEATIHNPSNVTNSKGWHELLETMLPDEKVLLRHAEGLDATKIVTSHTEPDVEVPDYAVRKQYVDLAYRVKGKITPSQVNVLNQGEMNMGLLVKDFEDDRST